MHNGHIPNDHVALATERTPLNPDTDSHDWKTKLLDEPEKLDEKYSPGKKNQ